MGELVEEITLHTSGCSFTQYCWPTWANYLGLHYRYFNQLGDCAIDNATVARNLLKAKINTKDHVVVCWTGMDRWVPYTKNGWLKKGCIASHKEYFVNYYHPIERFTTTMDYVKMIDLDSRDRGYSVWHFSAYPWFQGEVEKTIQPELIEIFNRYQIKNLYINQNLDDFKNQLGNVWTNHKYNSNDNHPTPEQHWRWLNQVIAPNIGITIDQDLENRVQYDNSRVLRGDVD